MQAAGAADWRDRAPGSFVVLPTILLSVLPDLADLSGEGPSMIAFREQIEEAIDLSQEMVEAGDADPIDWAVFNGAIRAVLRLAGNPPASCPLIPPLRDGGVVMEWHERGLNIELRFRAGSAPYVLVEDAMRIVPDHHDRDPDLGHAAVALRELPCRIAA